MDGSELTLDQAILGSYRSSQVRLDMKEQKCNTEISEEKISEMIKHQDSGDGCPTLEQESPKKTIPAEGDSEASMPADHGVSNLHVRQKELVDQSQQRPGAASIKNSTPFQRPSHQSSKWFISEEPYWNRQPLLSLQSQMASQMEQVNETEAKENVTWINQRTGKLMKCEGQQTSKIWEFKPLVEILQRSIQGSQIQDQEPKKGAQSEEGIVCSAELPAKPESCTSSQKSEEQELVSGLELEERPFHLEHLQDSQQPEEKKSCNDNKEDSNQAFPKISKSSQAQPTSVSDVERDLTWISPKTGLEMTCKSQQTSRIWVLKPLSEILTPSVQESQRSSDAKRRLESKSEGKVSFFEGTKSEPLPVESSRSSQLPQEQGLVSSFQSEEWNLSEHPASAKTPKPSQVKFTNETDVKKEKTWICPRTGLAMTCKSQQTSTIWDRHRLSKILQSPSQVSQKISQLMYDCGSKTNREMTESYTEGEDEVEQTYSIISVEEGILFNKKTHKILFNRSQQTSETAHWTSRGTTKSKESKLGADGPCVEGEQLEGQETQGERQELSPQDKPSLGSLVSQTEESKGNEEDTLIASCDPRVSEEVLFRIESSFVFVPGEDDLLSVYEGEGNGKEGSFINTQTGKVLESHCLQTETLSFQKSEGEAKAFPPEENQEGISSQ